MYKRSTEGVGWRLKALAAMLLAACAIALCTALPGQAWGATTVMDGEELENAFATSGEVELGGDFEVDKTITVPVGVSMKLDLNGHTITGTDNATGNFSLIDNRGTLTINDSVGNGEIVLEAIHNRAWDAYSSVLTNSPGGILTIIGGTIAHLGGSAMAYGIDNLTNGSSGTAKVTINGGVVESVYRSVRMFANSASDLNSLVITSGVLNGQVWLQSPNEKQNLASLVIEGGSFAPKGNDSSSVYVETASSKAVVVPSQPR